MMDFFRVVHQTIMSGTVVRYRTVNGSAEISSSRDGVSIAGSFGNVSDDDINDLVSVLYRAQELSVVVDSLSKDDVDKTRIVHEPECVIATHQARFGQEDVVLERRERSNN